MDEAERFVQGNQKLKQRIATIRSNLNLPPMIDELGRLLLRRTIDRFDRQVDPDGNPWKPLAPVTMRRRGEMGYPELPALRRSGTLRAAIQVLKGSASGSTYINTGASLRIGVDSRAGSYERVGGSPVSVAQVARYMQNGTPNVPARRFLGIGRLDVKAVDSYLRRRADTI